MITFNKSNILFTILFIISISFNIYFLTKNNNVDYSEYYKSIDSLNTKIQEKDIQLYLLKEQIDSISKYSRTDTNIIYEKYKEKYKYFLLNDDYITKYLRTELSKRIVLGNDTVWVFSREQTLKLVNIAVQRNYYQELSDSLKLDLSRCEFKVNKQDTMISLLTDKNNLYSSYILQQVDIVKKLETKQDKTRKQIKIYKNITLISVGVLTGLYIYKNL